MPSVRFCKLLIAGAKKDNLVLSADDCEMIMIDGGLGECELVQCLAHEMVHVKQIAKGQLRLDAKQRQTWLGQRVNTVYHERPWEQEAFARERLLASRALAYCEKVMTKRVNKLLKSV